jgi:glycosyltransferase involved in cell wall biosynthesis
MAALIELQVVSIWTRNRIKQDTSKDAFVHSGLKSVRICTHCLKVKTKLKFLFLESFFGGSHREFARGLVSHSKHRIDLVTMPARFWKWRMRGAALYFVNKIPSLEGYNGLITTGLMSLSDYKVLSKGKCPPALVYFHETQLTYPLAPGEHMDYQFGFTDITTALAAERVLFNSRTHNDSFFLKLPGFLKMMPEYRPNWVVEAIRSKAGVLYPGCRFSARAGSAAEFSREVPPLVIWNHRWEFDKNPDEFFQALDALVKEGAAFRLALLGENYQAIPKAFLGARERYGERIVQYGYVESRAEYIKWLKRGSIVISTARQENFGIAVIEAVRYGCVPLLPARLAYPEIIPKRFHPQVLYGDPDELVKRLGRLITSYSGFAKLRRDLSKEMSRFAWENLIDRYDQELEKLAQLA